MTAPTERDLKDRMHAQLARGQLQPALELLKQLITLNGRDPVYRLKHAEVSARLDRVDAAVASYRVAAHLLSGSGRVAQARAALHSAMRLAPGDMSVRRAVAGLIEPAPPVGRVALGAAADAITEPNRAPDLRY